MNFFLFFCIDLFVTIGLINVIMSSISVEDLNRVLEERIASFTRKIDETNVVQTVRYFLFVSTNRFTTRILDYKYTNTCSHLYSPKVLYSLRRLFREHLDLINITQHNISSH